MVKVRQNLVDGKMWGIKCPYEMKPEFVVIHNTANDASAENEIAYMRRNDKEVSFHYAVDDKEAVQGILEDRNAWHAGDGGYGNGNRCGIAIEICYSKSGGTRFLEAEKNAAELAASILKRYGWGIERLKKHQDFSGKYCPHRTLNLGWNRFREMVQAHLEDKPASAPETAKKSVEEVAREVINGDWGNGDERKLKLWGAGYDPKAVQDEVNRILLGKEPAKKPAKKSVLEIAKEVILGKWGNGADRKKRLKAAGYDPTEVQRKVNELLR